MPGVRVKYSPADKWFSKCIRLRTNHICEYCDQFHEWTECSHFYGRRHKSLRWDANNAVCLCGSCHRKLTENPAEHVRWFSEKMGDGMMEILREKSQRLYKSWKRDEKAIAKHYREQYKEMERKRADGVTGFLDFESW